MKVLDPIEVLPVSFSCDCKEETELVHFSLFRHGSFTIYQGEGWELPKSIVKQLREWLSIHKMATIFSSNRVSQGGLCIWTFYMHDFFEIKDYIKEPNE